LALEHDRQRPEEAGILDKAAAAACGSRLLMNAYASGAMNITLTCQML